MVCPIVTALVASLGARCHTVGVPERSPVTRPVSAARIIAKMATTDAARVIPEGDRFGIYSVGYEGNPDERMASYTLPELREWFARF